MKPWSTCQVYVNKLLLNEVSIFNWNTSLTQKFTVENLVNVLPKKLLMALFR